MSKTHRIGSQPVYPWKNQADRPFQLDPASPDREPQIKLLTKTLEPMFQRGLAHRDFLAEIGGCNARLVGWVEFPVMILAGVDEDTVPLKVKGITSDPAALKKNLNRERSLLIVAATRARDGLVITSNGTPSRFIQSIGQ